MTRFYNRVVAKRTTQKWVMDLDPKALTAAEISGNRGTKWPFKSYEAFWYPEHDICDGPIRDDRGATRQFDIVIADQVWEHLDFPYRATRNVRDMLKPGGHFLVVTPFYVKYHPAPTDCSRWSARGLKNLLIEAGFPEDGIRAEQWGNRQCAEADFGPKWGRYDGARHSLENDPDFPVMSWALARRD